MRAYCFPSLMKRREKACAQTPFLLPRVRILLFLLLFIEGKPFIILIHDHFLLNLKVGHVFPSLSCGQQIQERIVDLEPLLEHQSKEQEIKGAQGVPRIMKEKEQINFLSSVS